MPRHTRVGLVPHRACDPPDPSELAVLQTQVHALAAAVEQLADAIDVLIPDTPPTYADDHVRSAREELHTVWSTNVPPRPLS